MPPDSGSVDDVMKLGLNCDCAIFFEYLLCYVATRILIIKVIQSLIYSVVGKGAVSIPKLMTCPCYCGDTEEKHKQAGALTLAQTALVRIMWIKWSIVFFLIHDLCKKDSDIVLKHLHSLSIELM